MIAKPWESMYRALVHRITEITAEGQQCERYTRSGCDHFKMLETVATCHTGLLKDYDKERDG